MARCPEILRGKYQCTKAKGHSDAHEGQAEEYTVLTDAEVYARITKLESRLADLTKEVIRLTNATRAVKIAVMP